jgi:N-glycosylase/DNA lyase
MQVFYFLKSDQVVERYIPAPEASVVPGVVWGRPDVLFTAAYWMTQYWMREDGFPNRCHRLGRTFEEEVVACLLGGHGIPAEVGLAAFERLRDRGLIAGHPPSAEVLSDNLREPLMLEGRDIVYRFWSQKARYVSSVLTSLGEQPAPLDSPRALRDHLVQLPGIGPKTASWIVRNWLGSNDVAILDIHVVRAGQLMGLFSTIDRVEQHYLRMERRFLELAAAMNVPAANLDSLIWQNMRNSPRLVAGLFGEPLNTVRPLKRRGHHLPRQGQLQQA